MLLFQYHLVVYTQPAEKQQVGSAFVKIRKMLSGREEFSGEWKPFSPKIFDRPNMDILVIGCFHMRES